MTERVVLAGADGKAIGTALKSEVHTTDTALHFAFSAWVTCHGKVLITRRACAVSAFSEASLQRGTLRDRDRSTSIAG